GPEHPPSPDYVLVPEYSEFLVPSDNDILIEYQPLPADASRTALSPGYIANSDLNEDLEVDPKDDPEEDLADYPADGGGKEEEEFSGDDDEEEASEEEDDDEEEEEHLAPTDSSAIPIDDLIPSVRETEPFETDESAPTPPRLRRARISVRPQTPMATATKALIVAVAAALPSSSPPPSPLTLLSSPLP
ncbi:hypothetical protein Tco_0131236, partial [Tanacetum coccineum]